MAFGLVIPGLFNKVLRLAREGSNLVGESFLDWVGVLFFPKKVVEFYKMAVVKVGKSSSVNVVYAGGVHGLF